MVPKLNPEFVKKTYDKFLSEYPEEYAFYRWQRTPISRYHYRQSKRALLSFLNGRRYDLALEVGGGDGVWTEFFAPLIKNLDFIDISHEMIERAKVRLDNFKHIHFIEADFLHNNLPNGRYEALLSFRNFEYFPDKAKVASEFSRILKDGGDLFIVTKSLDFDWKGYYSNKPLHSGLIGIEDILTVLQAAHFKVKKVRPAIIGKGIRWKMVASCFDKFHTLLCVLPFNLLPLSISKYISESFIIHAVNDPNLRV